MRCVTLTVIGVSSLLGACNYQPKVADGVAIDAPASDSASACTVTWPYMPANFMPCDEDEQDGIDLTNGTFVFESETGRLLRADQTVVATYAVIGTSPRILAIEDLSIAANATLKIVGTEPLIIAVHGAATIRGTVTVAATGSTPGAGAATCLGMVGGDADGAVRSAGGGGAGGGFGTIGANGGTGDSDATPTPGGDQSPVVGFATLIPLRGGCAGGPGGQEHPSTTADPGGGGGAGGAIQISARDAFSLRDDATIQAGGGGGLGAVNQANGNGGAIHAGAGGGGGGSGGAILIEGNTVVIETTATLCANGGGGGGGSHDLNGNLAGLPGSDAACAESGAMGGTGDGDGGIGGFTSSPAPGTAGAGNDGGGGGGGGGGGRIRVHANSGPLPSVASSPTATIN